MMKIVLASTFLLALAYSASAESIQCYVCGEGDVDLPGTKTSITKFFQTRADSDGVPKTLCKDPIENSTLVTINTDSQSCVKLDVEVTMNDKSAEATFRMVLPKDTCPDFEKAYVAAATAAGADADANCYECQEDKCNLASTVQVSFLMLLAPALAYLMRS